MMRKNNKLYDNKHLNSILKNINKSFISDSKYLIDIVVDYSDIIHSMMVCFVTATEEEKKAFEKEELEKTQILYQNTIKSDYDNNIKNIVFMVLSKEMVDKKYEGNYYYAML